MNPVWTERDRQRYRRQMAHHTVPVAELPDGRLVYEDELDLTPRERRDLVVGAVLVTALIVALIVAPLAIGGLLIEAFGW